MTGPYLEPAQEAGGRFVRRRIEGNVVMLNLLRFRETADYSDHPDLTPPAPISGAEAFDRYIRHTLPYLRETGGDLVFLGAGGPFLIGPEEESWDLVIGFCAYESRPLMKDPPFKRGTKRGALP